MKRRVLTAVLAVLLAVPAYGVAQATDDTTEIKVLSNRTDLNSGGDALVEVTPDLPDGSVVTLNGEDMTASFAVNPQGRTMALLTGLQVGQNQLTVAHADGRGATLAITNHPIEGPVFSGPHLQP